MANVWGAKYHEAEEGQKIWRLVVPKNVQMDFSKFEQFIARQSGQDSGFRIRKKALWTAPGRAVDGEEDEVHPC